ncbi:MAG: FtsW/RodA/SpoVE family cell cycle protein [Saprospiraceae bacterium]|nr:FtsW/RodA/SpoVE family cell cycle protein [Saprospiraceae bacterium]
MSLGTKINDSLQGDRVIWGILALLSLFSLLAVYSASGSMAFKLRGGNTEYYLMKHMFFVCVGLGLTYFCYKRKYTSFAKVADVIYWLSIPVLLYTIFWGAEINDARRWISVPVIGMTFQPSDFAKLALIIYIAKGISQKQEYIKDFNSAFLPLIVPVLLTCLLIAPADLSSSVLLFTVSLLMMWVGRVDIKFIGLLVLLGLSVFAILVIVGMVFPEIVRVETWVNRLQEFFSDSEGGFQIQQSKIAIAMGGLFGEGPGASLQRNYLPAPYSDFIYAIICEEYGLLGGFTILSLYVAFFYRCIVIVTKNPKAFGSMLVIGLGLLLTIQALANIAVSVHFVPVTGLTLPMVSMGGTSVLFTSIAIGIILSVSRTHEKVT